MRACRPQLTRTPEFVGGRDGRLLGAVQTIVGPLHDVCVLVVDDDPDMRQILRAWIEQTGATVLAAADGARALELARAEKPDLVFCDLRMPRFDGYAFMSGFARDEELSRVPVLVLSGEMDPAEIRRTWEAGFAGHLVKPVTKDAVLAQIQRVLPAAAR